MPVLVPSPLPPKILLAKREGGGEVGDSGRENMKLILIMLKLRGHNNFFVAVIGVKYFHMAVKRN